MDRRARGGRALIRRDVGVEPHRPELAHVEIELFADDLEKTRGVALPELAFAEIDRRGVVDMDRDPGIDRIGIRWASDIAARGGCRTSHAREAEADDEGATALEQVAARERELVRNVGHRVSPAILADATLMA